MPIYEYECQQCGEFEVTQKITDPSLSLCPTCGAPIKKLISNTSFKLVGSGWYLTDYARKGSSSGDGVESKAAPNKGDGKADASTAAEKKAAGDVKSAKGQGSESTAPSS